MYIAKRKLNYNIKNVVATIVILIFYLSYFLKMIHAESHILAMTFSMIMLGVGSTSALYILIFKKFKYKIKIIILFFFLYFWGAFSSLYNNNYGIEDYLLPFQYLGIGLLILCYKLDIKVQSISFLSFSFYFILNAFLGRSPDSLFFGFSRNSVSVFMIIQCTLLYISMYKNNIKIKVYPAIITVVISFWGIGRSGIGISIFLLFGVITYLLFSNNKITKKIYLIFGLIIFMMILTTPLAYELLFANFIQRTSYTGLIDTHRLLIIREYFKQVSDNFHNFLLGVPLSENEVFLYYGLNLHNSYLKLHAYFGIFGFVTVFILFTKSLIKYVIYKDVLPMILLLTLILRMATDITSINGPFDPILYFLVINSMLISKNNRQVQLYS